MKTFVVAHFSLHTGELKQFVVHSETREGAVCKVLTDAGFSPDNEEEPYEKVFYYPDDFISVLEILND